MCVDLRSARGLAHARPALSPALSRGRARVTRSWALIWFGASSFAGLPPSGRGWLGSIIARSRSRPAYGQPAQVATPSCKQQVPWVVPQVHGQPGMQAKQAPASVGQVITRGPSIGLPASRSGHWRRHFPSQHCRSSGHWPATSQAMPSFQPSARHETAIQPAASAATTVPSSGVRALANGRGTATQDSKIPAHPRRREIELDRLVFAAPRPSPRCLLRRLDTA